MFIRDRFEEKPVEIQNKVVVITGASSGIGRATAHRFAERGARVVVAARRMPLLKQAVDECATRGGNAIAIQVDVSDPKSVDSLARQAVEGYGRVDIWVNNAAVSLFARVDEGPLEMHRRVIETNLLGYLYGARAAVRIFREQGSGVLVNGPPPQPMSGSPSRVPMLQVNVGSSDSASAFARR